MPKQTDGTGMSRPERFEGGKSDHFGPGGSSWPKLLMVRLFITVLLAVFVGFGASYALRTLNL